MSHLLDDDDDLMPRRDRELTLSTGAILGIFFGLVLICGLFFAFGYNLGHKSAAPQLASTDDNNSTSSSSFNNFKPSAGSPSGGGPVIPLASTSSVPVTPPPAAAASSTVPAESATPADAAPSSGHPAPIVLSHPAPTADMPSASATGSFVVQIAAVSHQEDANLLVNALQGKGYSVAAHSEPQDKLFHIQVGPFNSRRDAEAMRQRLLADGYNALVK